MTTFDSTSLQPSATASECIQRIAATLQRDINIIIESSSTKFQKKASLNSITKHLLDQQDQSIKQGLFELYLCQPLLKCWQDQAEMIRGMSAQIILDYCMNAESVISCLQYITPALSSRLSHLELVEQSEEIRFVLVQIACQITVKSADRISPFCDNLVGCLRRTLSDSFPEVRKESCKLVIELALNCPKTLQYYGAEISTLLFSSLLYRHASVRTIALDALKSAIIVDQSGLDDCLKYVYIASRDKSSQVRQHVYALLAWWLTFFDDRYSFAHKLLPILLSGLDDDLEALRVDVFQKLQTIGLLYEKEWADKCKQQLDQTPLGGQDPLQPFVGTRNYIKENAMKIIQNSLKMMEAWSMEERMQGLKILRGCIDMIEENLTGYTTGIVNMLVKMSGADTDADVLKYVTLCAMKVGQFVDPEVYLEGMLQNINSNNSAQYRIGCVTVLDALINGSPSSVFEQNMDVESDKKSFIARITDCITLNEIIGNDNLVILEPVAKLVLTLCMKVGESASIIQRDSQLLLNAIMLLKCAKGTELVTNWKSIQETADICLLKLVSAYKFTHQTQLFELFYKSFLDTYISTHTNWTKHSYELPLFQRIVIASQTCSSFASNIDSLLKILSNVAIVEKEYEVRTVAIQLSKEIIKQGRMNAMNINVITGAILLPNLIWRGGPKAALLRHITMQCMNAIICSEVYMSMITQELYQPLVTCLVSNVDDDLPQTRAETLNCFEKLLNQSTIKIFDGQQLRLIYPEILKRMDDAQNEIRIKSAFVFACIFKYMVGNGMHLTDDRFDDGILKHMFQTLILHMDDQDIKVQESVFRAIESVCALNCVSLEVWTEVFNEAGKNARSSMLVDRLKALVN